MGGLQWGRVQRASIIGKDQRPLGRRRPDLRVDCSATAPATPNCLPDALECDVCVFVFVFVFVPACLNLTYPDITHNTEKKKNVPFDLLQ